MTKPTYASSAEAKKAGWFSRRHQTRTAHDDARARYLDPQFKVSVRNQPGAPESHRLLKVTIRGWGMVEGKEMQCN